MKRIDRNYFRPNFLLCLISTFTRSFGAPSRPFHSVTVLGRHIIVWALFDSNPCLSTKEQKVLLSSSVHSKTGRVNEPRNLLPSLLKRLHWLVRVNYQEWECVAVDWEEREWWFSFMHVKIDFRLGTDFQNSKRWLFATYHYHSEVGVWTKSSESFRKLPVRLSPACMKKGPFKPLEP